MIKIYKFLLVLSLFVNFSFAKEFNLIIPTGIEPLEEIELKIIQQVYKKSNIKLNIKKAPFLRVTQVFKADKSIDIALTRLKDNDKDYFSKIIANYVNIIVTREGHSYSKFDDLSHMKTVGFPGAKEILGKKYKNTVQKNKYYSEQSNQEGQVSMLYHGRVDVIVLADAIFYHFWKKLNNKFGKKKFIVHYNFSPPYQSRLLFKNKSERDDFNKLFEKSVKSGEIEKIIKEYKNVPE